jgi:hypothetical protein
LFYLPACSPELNRIEPVFKQVKHHDMPTRSFATRADLRKAVEDGFAAYRRRLREKADNELRLAAYRLCHNLERRLFSRGFGKLWQSLLVDGGGCS